MAFNLKKVLRALLFSSSNPLSVKDIQAAFDRFHEQAAAARSAAGEEAAEAAANTLPSVTPPPEPDAPDAPVDGADTPPEKNPDADLYEDVPLLVTAAQIREAMDGLAAELREAGGELLLIEGAGGYRLVSHPRYARWIRILRDEPPPVRLSQSALETLAIVAYRQPVTRSEIEAIRGVSAEAGINRLLERELVVITGRADLPGRPLQYGTTERFLEYVGVKSIVELPSSDVLTPRQIDAWLQSHTNVTPPADAEMGLPIEETTPAPPAPEADAPAPSAAGQAADAPPETE
ncbi:MAG: SMC-Scp complex subunit ScpB [Opitutaceae bacterium]|jgi:segregation and condensation protein B|nr:SMC-Scp complex subunit ScpB [Opitutaceae bacterium]